MFCRRLVPLVVLCLSASLPLLAIDTNEPAPRFHARTVDGESYDNDSLKGKVVLLQFWATWCKYCRADQEHVDGIAKEYADKGLVVLAVNSGEAKKVVKKYLDNSPRTCKIVLMPDTNLAALFPTTGFPLYVLIDRQGKIAGTQRGAGGEDALRSLLAKAGLDTE
jgi:thiol-disulfide isomerase/thioredoxin